MKFEYTLKRRRDDEKGKVHNDTQVFASLDEIKNFLNSLSADGVTPDEELDSQIPRAIKKVMLNKWPN